jgi:Protein of unknown function (DUF938)
MENLPYSQACENNKQAILKVLQDVFAESEKVLEVGSGTGQHATHFAAHLPDLVWQPTEQAENLPALHPRCAAYQGQNLLAECELDVNEADWPPMIPDAMFTANTLHIMSFDSVRNFFAGIGRGRPENFVLAVYGPFNYDGEYTSQSNARFDVWLAQQHPDSAIRDFEAVNTLAKEAGLTLHSDNEMPANNRLLVWKSPG